MLTLRNNSQGPSCSHIDQNFEVYWLPDRHRRKDYLYCPLCQAITDEPIITQDQSWVIIHNKYPVFPNSRLLLPIHHRGNLNTADIEYVLLSLMECDDVALYTSRLAASIPAHIHFELLQLKYVKRTIYHFSMIQTSNDLYTISNHIVPIVAVKYVSSEQFHIRVHALIKMAKQHGLTYNLIVSHSVAFFHFLHLERAIESKFGARETLGIFATSRYCKFVRLARSNVSSIVDSMLVSIENIGLMLAESDFSLYDRDC